MIIFTILKLAKRVFEIVGLYKLFGILGEKQWKSFIPFYNEFILFRKVWNTDMFWLYTLADVVGAYVDQLDNPSQLAKLISFVAAITCLVCWIKYCKYYSKAFGKGAGTTWLTFFFPVIVYAVMGFSKDTEYLGNQSKKQDDN